MQKSEKFQKYTYLSKNDKSKDNTIGIFMIFTISWRIHR